MKVLVVFCIIAHLTSATPPFTDLFGSLLGGGSEGGSTGGAFGGSNPLSAVSGLIGSGAGRRTLGDVLGVKISLLSALQSAVNGGSQTIDVEGGGDGVIDGMGGGLGIEESSGGSAQSFAAGSQSFAAGSGFSQMVGIGESSNHEQGFGSGSGYSNAQQGSASVDNSYVPPSSGNGYASNGGYAYNRPAPPPPPPASYASESSSGSAKADSSFSGLSASEFASGSSSLESGNFGSTSSDQTNAGGATQSGTSGLSGIVGMLIKFYKKFQVTKYFLLILGSIAQLPIRALTSYRSGINRGFDTVAQGISTLQALLGGSSSSRTSIDELESNNLRRRY